MKTTKQNSWMATRLVHLFQVRRPLAAKLFAAIIFLAGMTQNISAQTYSLTGLWYAPANPIASDNLIVSPGDHNRGMAYDPISNRVFVSAKGGGAPAPGIEAINADTGAFVNLLDTTVVSGGTFLLSQVGVAADGAIYAANLVNPGSPTSITKIYRWTNSTSVATVAYAGNTLSNSVTSYNIGTSTYGRVGDAMAVSGSGTGTVIVMPVATTSPGLSTNLILFTTTDGLNFSSHILTVSGFAASGSAICGVSFYTNNTLLIRTSGGAGNNVFLIQYPANIASMDAGPVPGIQLGSYALPNVVSTTAFISYPTGTPGGLFAVASPQNSGGAAAVAQVALYTDPVVGAGGCSLLQATTNYPHLVTNGNLAGAVALDVVHNRIYSLDCNNGVRATSITTIPPQPPTISAQPVGGNAYVPFTLNVTAAGYCPLVYQWQATNPAVAGEFTNIPGANASSYTITTAITNYYRVVITNTINPSVTSAVVQVIGRLPVSNASVAQLWRAAAGSLPFLSTSDNNGRGIAYDTNLDRVVVAVASASSPSLNVLNGTTGASLGAMGTSGLTINGTFAVDQVAIADDGRVYSCNLGYNGTIAVNVWTNAVPGANPSGTPAFFSSPGGPAERYGDNMAIRGGGTTTQILIPSSLAPGIGVGPGTNVVLLRTTDGISFSSTVIGVSGVPGGFAGSGVAFGTGNSFWAKSYNGDLFQIAYDPDAGTGTVMLDYSSSGQVPQNTMGLGIDPVLNLMATILQGDVPDSVALFQLTGTTAAPVLFNQSLMSNNGNANANGAIVMKNNRLYALDVNNGVIALSYASPAGTAPSIVTQPQSTTAYTNTTANFTVVASGTLTLNYQWRFNSNNIVGAPNSATYSVVNPSPAAAGYYDVVVQNASGSITSAPALLTVKIPVLSPVVTNVWALAPGSRSYLDSSTYSTRGLACDPTQGHLLVADHFNIYVLDAADNSDLGTLNMAGVPAVGFSQWLVDQVRVADDGVVYAANLQDNSYGSAPLSIVSFPSSSPGTGATEYVWGGETGADPSGIGARVGDTMAVRGSGLNTELLMGTPDSNIVILFTNNGSTYPSITFNAVVITVPGAPVGFASGGVAFGAGNTFWAKGENGYNLRQVTYSLSDPANAVVSQSFTAATQVPNSMTGIGVDVANNILAGVVFDDTPDDLQLFLLSGNTNPPALFNQAFFPYAYVNSQLNSATDIKYPWAFALNVNNGILALNYGVPAGPRVQLTSISYAPGSVTIQWNNTFAGHSYQVQRTKSLNPPAWANIGAPVPASGGTASYTDTTSTDATQFYRVITQ